MDSQTILKKLNSIEDLPTLPAIALEVNKMLEDYDTSIKRLSGRIERDQAMVAKIMKLVNSAFFGLRSQVSNIPHAVVLLGFNTVRNAVISVSIIDSFSGEDLLEGFNIMDFWSHSVAVAVTSRHLAEQIRLQSPDDCFIGGLLHDIGKVILSQYFQDLFKRAWTSAQENKLSFYEAEKKEIPVNHAQIGGHLSKKWQLPAGLADAIQYHHAIRKNVLDLNLLLIVHASDIIVNSYGVDSKGKLNVSALHSEALRTMGPQLDSVSKWFPEISNEIESACKFFLEGVEK